MANWMEFVNFVDFRKLYCAREKRFESRKILNYLCDMLLWIFISPKVFRHSSYSGFLVLSIFKIYFDILDVLHHYPLDLFLYCSICGKIVQLRMWKLSFKTAGFRRGRSLMWSGPQSKQLFYYCSCTKIVAR